MGLACSVSGLLINKHLETAGDLTAEDDRADSISHQSLGKQISYNFQVCRNALKERAMYLTILFFAVEGFTVPNFFEFIYYFAVNEAKMSQMEWGLCMVMVNISIMAMIGIYAGFLKGKEPRSLIKLSVFLFLLSAISQQFFVAGYYRDVAVNHNLFLAVGVMCPLGFAIALTHIVP